MKETIKILTMIALVLAIMLIFMTLGDPAKAEPEAEPVCINTEATEAEAAASLKELSSGHVLKLADDERELVERIVAGEARGESLECQMACAQAIRDRSLEWNKPVADICTAEWQFCEP